MINRIIIQKIYRIFNNAWEAVLGRAYPLQPTLDRMAARPFELHLELTNLCNAKCIFCPYQFQTREIEFMPDEIFFKAVSDFCATGGGSVGLTPIVGDALIDPKLLDRIRYLRRQEAIDRIFLTTNAILLHKHGIREFLNSGISSVTISTAGFEEEMYRRVYQSNQYREMRDNVLRLLEENSRSKSPIPITIAMRPDRPLDEVMRQPDFLKVQAFGPILDFTWAYTTANGRITESMLPAQMRLRKLGVKKEACVNLYNGPIVLPDGRVLACSCVAAIDAPEDLEIGNLRRASLSDIWRSHRLQELREEFTKKCVNKTCGNCDMYRDLSFYRTAEGRERGMLNAQRQAGMNVKRRVRRLRPFMGG